MKSAVSRRFDVWTQGGRRIRAPLVAALLITFSGIFMITAFSMISLLRANLEEELEHVTEAVGQSIEDHLQNKVDAMDLALLLIAGDIEIREAFEARDSQALLSLTSQLYRRLNDDHQVSHFYFVLPNRETLLRVHHPDRRGDVINRPSMQRAEKTGQSATGIEMGPLGTFTLRNVKPWYHKDQLIGYIELGQEVDHFLQDLQPRSGTDFVWMVGKDLVNQKSWEAYGESAGLKTNWDQYTEYIIAATSYETIPHQISTREDLLNSGEINQSVRIVIDGATLLYTSMPVDQWRQQGEGHLGVIVDVSDVEQLFRTSMMKMSIWLFVIVLGAWAVYYRVLGRVERTVIAAYDHLEETVAQRTEELSETNRKLECEVAERKITEKSLLLARAEADAASQAKSEFVAGMSHELRTPMNAVLGFAQILQSDNTNPLTPDQLKRVDHIISAGNHLLELVNEVLDLARVEAGQLDLELETVNLNEAIAECVTLALPLAMPGGIEVIDEVSDDQSVNLHTDALRFKQVVINLLSNAIKYNEVGGTVTVKCLTVEDGFLRLSVTDTGVGIAENDHEKLFQMFHRLGVHKGSEIEGSGIGLATTKVLVEKMNGRIGFESEEGAGSTFWIELPLAESTQFRSTAM